MAIALVAHTFKVGAGTTPSIDTTGASLIVVTSESVGTPTLSDSSGNTPYIAAIAGTGPDTSHNILWYFPNPSTSGTHTFTVTVAGTGVAFEVTAWSGVLTSSDPLDQVNQQSAPGADNPGSITPSQNNELVISSAVSSSAVSWTIDSGFTISDQSAPDFSGNQSAQAYLIQTTAGAVNPTWTGSPNITEVSNIASFKAASSGPSAKKKASMFLVF